MDSVLFTTHINVFLSRAILAVDSKSIMKLVPFIQAGFFPGQGEATNTDTGERTKVIKVDKMAGELNLSVVFSPWAIHLVIESQEVQSMDLLTQQVADIFKLLNETFDGNIPGIRLATVVTHVLKHDEKLECKIYQATFKSEDVPSEWSFRHVRTSQVEQEKINNNLSVNKGNATAGIRGRIYTGDVIVVNVDNNTHLSNLSERFGVESPDFIDKLLSKTISDVANLIG
ncbi:hypothetical protein [Raoultella terrigena]|uniref:hypothetical protein n=1 Tax=Raoultella terrigena TaxID=577 RepID=UPI00384FABEF